MTRNALKQLRKFEQSFWFDNIQRSMLDNGDIERMIADQDLRGITSNPSIFEKAITSGSDYDSQIRQLLREKPSADNRAFFFELAIRDIQGAADKLRGVYDQSKGLDGYVSLEVSPDLAHNTQASIDEARELFRRINRPNAMIKIPATKAGIPVIEQLIADGIHVNATLLFSVERYVEVAKAYIRGLQARKQRSESLAVASVASFFVSRVDSKLDPLLDKCAGKTAAHDALHGQIAVLNAKAAYVEYQKLFDGKDFAALKSAGAVPQRLLWASTGTKNAAYSDVLYIEQLIGPHTVNTIPPATAKAFHEHGNAANTLMQNLAQAPAQFGQLAKLGIDMNKAMQELEDEGVSTFAKSFDNLLAAIGEKRNKLAQNAA
ncbi:MAG: transaldolase [Gammaproteobacteria bacterium]|nr:transaldolase [Gammaproteobacteria bacterium]